MSCPKCKQEEVSYNKNENHWLLVLKGLNYDWQSDTWDEMHTNIEYCPYCGYKLNKNITKEDKKSLSGQLSEKLLELSSGRLNNDISDQIAQRAINNIDFDNSALTHKGLNWYAENIINMIDFRKLK